MQKNQSVEELSAKLERGPSLEKIQVVSVHMQSENVQYSGRNRDDLLVVGELSHGLDV